jgi:hypothetical protein
MISRSLLVLSLLAVCVPRAEETGHNQAVYASPIAMMYLSGMTDVAVISGAYEHRLTATGYSLFIPLHGAYREDRSETRYAFGAGLGLRKYFGSSFSGSYLTAQSDLLRFRDYEYEYIPSVQNPDGTWTGGESRNRPRTDFVSISQLSYGHKWDWRQFTLDLTIGGAFYAREDEKFTNVIGVNVGFPFNAGMFGFH